MFDPGLLSDKSILVTGGGSGLGLAMAKACAAHGAAVTIAGRKLERLEEAAKEIAAAARAGGAVEIFAADDDTVSRLFRAGERPARGRPRDVEGPLDVAFGGRAGRSALCARPAGEERKKRPRK